MKKDDRLEYIFKSLKLMSEEDLLSGNEEAVVEQIENMYKRLGKLSYYQDDILQDIYRRASGR